MKKIIFIVGVAAVLVIAMILRTHNNQLPTVGIIQYGDESVWTLVKTGLEKGFVENGFVDGKNISLDFEDAHGDNSTMQSIAENFVNKNIALILPFGTAPSQAILHLEKTKPIVFAAVTDPKSAGLVDDLDHPGKNITGTSDITLYDQSLKLLKELVPSAKKIGVLQNPGEANSVFGLTEVRKYASELNLEVVVATVTNSADVYQAAKSISGKVDAFYELPDNTVLAGSNSLIKASLEDKKPLIALDDDGVKNGALAALATDYVKVGEHTADIAAEVLKGKNPGIISVLGITDADLSINTKTASLMNIQIPEAVSKEAKIKY